MRLAGFPAFVRELDATLSVHPQYVLWGNLHDSFLVPQEGRLFPLRDLLWETLRRSGYSFMVVYDQVDGLRVHPADDPAATDAAASLFGNRVDERKVPSLEGLRLPQLTRPAGPPDTGRLRHRLRLAHRPQPHRAGAGGKGLLRLLREAVAHRDAGTRGRRPSQAAVQPDHLADRTPR